MRDTRKLGCLAACGIGAVFEPAFPAPRRHDHLRAAGIEPGQAKGLRKRTSPMCTLSQNGYGDPLRPPGESTSRDRRIEGHPEGPLPRGAIHSETGGDRRPPPPPALSLSKEGGRGSPYLSLFSFFLSFFLSFFHSGSLLSSTPQGRGKNSATGTRTRVARVRAEYPNQLDYSGCCSSTRGAGLLALRLARPIPTTGDAKRRARSRRNGSPPESGCPS